MSNSIDQFRLLIEPWKSTYSQIRVSAIGVYEADRPLILYGRIILTSLFGGQHQKEESLKTPLIWGRSQTLPFSSSQLPALLKNFAEGKLIFDDIEASLPTDEIATLNPIYHPGHHPSLGLDSKLTRSPTLIVTRGSKYVLLGRLLNVAELEWHLRSLIPPYADLNDLHMGFGLPMASTSGDMGLLELIARPPVEIDTRSSIHEGIVKVIVIGANSIDQNKVSVGFRALNVNMETIRGVIDSTEFKWSTENSFLKGEAQVNIESVSTMQCFLSYAKTSVQQYWIADPKRVINPRLAIHTSFDPELKLLERLLFESKKNEKHAFEDGVAVLLGLLGFSVWPHGRPEKLSDGPDLIAITPTTSNVAVVECTTGLPDQDDQVAKVLRRSSLIRKSLSSSGWPRVEILPVIVTSLSRAEGKHYINEAEAKGVAIIFMEELKQAIVQAQIFPDAEKVYRDIQYRLKPRLGD